jgi:hypothetical protein
MKNIMFIMGCGLVVKLRRGEWNGLTGHPKDCGNDQPNSKTNSLQHGENDVDQTKFRSLFVIALNLAIERPPALDCTNDNNRSQ